MTLAIDREIRATLNALEGPARPLSTERRQLQPRPRRTAAMALLGLAALAAPGALAAGGLNPIRAFLTTATPSGRAVIGQLNHAGSPPGVAKRGLRVVAAALINSVRGPRGEIRLYKTRNAAGQYGLGFSSPHDAFAAACCWQRLPPAPITLALGNGGPNGDVLAGWTNPRIASVTATYSDATTQRASVKNGTFLLIAATTRRHPTTLIARTRSGQVLAQLRMPSGR